MPNVDLRPLKELSSFRRLAIGTWQTAYDPSVYGSLEVRMDKSIAYMEAFRAKTGRRVTVTHLVAKACAEALRRCPEANAILRFNRIYLRNTVDLSILVVQPDDELGKVDLTTCKVNDADKRSIFELSTIIEEQVARVRERRDLDLERGKKTAQWIPYLLLNVFLKALSVVMYALNINLQRFGLPRDPFGGITITNIGSLGLDIGFVPLVPYSRVPILVAPGAIREAPVVEDGKIVVGRVMRLNATFDHRFIDGYHASMLARTIVEMFENPSKSFGAIEDLPSAT